MERRYRLLLSFLPYILECMGWMIQIFHQMYFLWNLQRKGKSLRPNRLKMEFLVRMVMVITKVMIKASQIFLRR